jgi:arsenite methyltransferase
MNQHALSPESDAWSDWLLRVRYGGDAERERVVQFELRKFVKRVLDGAALGPGMTLADIGTGDGLVGLAAIDRIGPTLRVIFADQSAPLLRHTEARAVGSNVRSQCAFVQCSAESLVGVSDATVDAVTLRAVLAYVPDKPAAMREFRRVLKPGGRLSIAEPVMRDDAFETSALRQLIENRPEESGDNFFHLLHRWKSALFPDTDEKIAANPITNYGERDLVRFALDAGLKDVHMEFHIDVLPALSSWNVLLDSSPHPAAACLRDVLAERFTADERIFFENIFRPEVEAGRLVTVERTAYLTARKPDIQDTASMSGA